MRRPASSASRQASAPNPFVTATIATSPGSRPARSMRSRTDTRRSRTVISAPSFEGDDRAESNAVGAAPVRGQEGSLLRAQVHRMDVANTRFLELRAICRGEVEEESATGPSFRNAWVELRGDLLPHLVAPAAYAGAQTGDDRAWIRAELVVHAPHGDGADPGEGAAPARVGQPNTTPLGIKKDDWITVCKRREQRHSNLVGDKRVDSVHHFLRLVNSGECRTVNGSHDGQTVETQRARKITPRLHDRRGIRRMGQPDVAKRESRKAVDEPVCGLKLGDLQN